jgi:hypothetical protein
MPLSLTPTEQEVRAFVGSMAGYYLRAWRRARAGEGGASGFNIAGFFPAGLWLACRKMYAATLILFGIIVESVLEEALFAGILDEGREASLELISPLLLQQALAVLRAA